jgi:3-oxoacyl-(acyl-carrier-protein) synthase
MTLSSLGITNQEVKISSPFGADRCGAVISEGGAFLVLENMELALARKAHIYAELAGFGQSTDSDSVKLYSQFVSPLKKCMQEAIKDAGIDSHEIDYINASANSHLIGDMIEAEAINEVFENNRPLVSSTKAMTGDLVAGSSSFELALAALFLKEQVVPPTVNKNRIDKKINLNFTAEKAQHKELNMVLSNNFEMGNSKVSFILKRKTE